MTRYLVHGLRVFSPELALPLPPDPAPRTPPDVVVRMAHVDRRDDGVLVASCDGGPGGSRYEVRRHPDGVTIDFTGAALVHIHPDGQVVVLPRPGTPAGLVGVLVAGPSLVTLLVTRGHPVLHASAVLRRGRLLALVGPPGAGKSSLAMLLAAEGLALHSDDSLRLRPGAAEVLAARGGLTTRLRDGSPLAVAADGVHGAASGDGRALRPPDHRSRSAWAPLAAVVLPRLVTDAPQPTVRSLPGPAAVAHLARNNALAGVVDPAVITAHFQAVVATVSLVPVVVLDVPWDIGAIPDDLGARVGAALESALTAA